MRVAATAPTTATAAMTHQASWKAACTSANPRGAPSTATSSETPRTKPICRDIVTTADPVADLAGGRSAVAADMIVGRAKPTPMPPMSQPGSIAVTYSGCAPTEVATSSVPPANSRQPTDTNTPAGTRADIRCDTAANTGTISGPGAI